MAKRIVDLMPKHTVYVEPFAGSAAVIFKKPLPQVTNNNHYREVINDLHSEIVNFYRVCRDADKREKLLDMLNYTLYSHEEFRAVKRGEYQESDIEKAWSWFVNINQSFANTAHAGWGTVVYGTSNPITFQNKIKSLPEQMERFKNVYVENLDACELIRKWDSPQTLFYVDPPYPETDQGGYRHKYTMDDFKELVETINNCSGAFLLSAYDVGLCPDSWERFEFIAHCSASSSGKTGSGRDKSKKSENLGERSRTEVVWRRMATVPVRPEIKKLYDSTAFACFSSEGPST